MTGLTFLNAYLVQEGGGFRWNWWVLLILIPAAIIAVFVQYLLHQQNIPMKKFYFSVLIIAVCIILIVGLIVVTCRAPKYYDRYYEATIDETVPYLALTEHYEVIEQRGTIYILKGLDTND